ncbi:MAG: Gfo/Idh/MocA family oxidoreductase [Planctomycetes bacterium]|nr:Gfo/Idh/MocA family oxidoreductase [Planctomycetota bacterium]
MDPIRVAVVGAGHLGKHHARLLHGLDEARLAYVVDSRADVAEQVATAYGAESSTDFRALVGAVDAACVVTPTETHREIAGFLLENGVDVLVEKPIAPTEQAGRELVEIAREHGRILQVGHVERFNSALGALKDLDLAPRYIESQRLAPFSFRSVDIGVVLDLMVHDLDIVLDLIGSEVVSVEAFGGAVFTPAEDMATATLKFENGAIAQLTASRIALKPMRRMRIFSPDGYVSLDFHEAQGTLIQKSPSWDYEKLDLRSVDTSKIDDLWRFVFDGLLKVEQIQLDSGNPLRDELSSFLGCVRDRAEPVVSGEQGCRAVALACRVLESIKGKTW